MKTRIVQTKFWDDPLVLDLKKNEKYLFIFFLTCAKNNLTGIFEMTDYEILFLTGMKKEELLQAKQVLQQKKRIAFYENWICVTNSKKYNNYESFERHKKAYDKEISTIPVYVLEHINNTLTSQIPVETSQGLDLIQNTEIRNQKAEGGLLGGVEELQTVPAKAQGRNDSHKPDPFLEWITFYNKTYNGHFRGSEELRKNFDIWFKLYSLDEMKEAVKKIQYDKYWGDKHSPTILLRTRDSNGPVDRIGDMLNQKTKGYKKPSRLLEVTREAGLLQNHE